MRDKISNVRIEATDNGGCIVRYDRRYKPEGARDTDNMEYEYKEESFGPSEEQFGEAIGRFKELRSKQLECGGSGGEQMDMPVKGY